VIVIYSSSFAFGELPGAKFATDGAIAVEDGVLEQEFAFRMPESGQS
jgi:hypothetical protein